MIYFKDNFKGWVLGKGNWLNEEDLRCKRNSKRIWNIWINLDIEVIIFKVDDKK